MWLCMFDTKNSSLCHSVREPPSSLWWILNYFFIRRAAITLCLLTFACFFLSHIKGRKLRKFTTKFIKLLYGVTWHSSLPMLLNNAQVDRLLPSIVIWWNQFMNRIFSLWDMYNWTLVYVRTTMVLLTYNGYWPKGYNYIIY